MSQDMHNLIRIVTGTLVGAVVGFFVGVFGWLAFFYLVFMLPHGTSFRYMDQGAIPIVLTGPLGVVIGAAVGIVLSRRRIRQLPTP
jgi:hypothetical protein